MRYRYACIAFLLAMLTAVSCAACGRVAVAGQTDASNAHSVKARKKTRSGSASVSRRLTAQQRLTAAVAPLIQADGGQVAVAVDDLTTSIEAAYHGTSEFATASIVKVDILATLLYELQRSGQTMTDEDQDLATTMIENSDNDAASALYADIGGPTPWSVSSIGEMSHDQDQMLVAVLSAGHPPRTPASLPFRRSSSRRPTPWPTASGGR
jgi:beta-lactamase class A